MKTFLTVLVLLISFSSLGSEYLTTNTMKDIEAKALALGKKYGVKNVLVALDIDNTVLTMPHDLGSDQWFTWQYEGCIKKKNVGDHCITMDMGELLDIQGQLFALTNMVPTEPVTPAVISNLQKKGFKVILLTSRGPGFRNVTERSLKQNKLHFRHSAIGPKKGFASTYSPFDVKNPKKYGITKKDIADGRLKGKGRPVSYMDGVYMTSGQHKGVMLKALMHKTKSKFKAIVFADDHEKHTKRMTQTFGKPVAGVKELVTYRYGAIDKAVKSFKASEDRRKAVSKAWDTLKETTHSVLK
jgi:hypothetical protein